MELYVGCDILFQMKIAILGGRFDPIHTGHLLIARQVLEMRPDISKVILVPAFQHQWKPIIASPKQRTAMIKLVLEKGIEISNIELERKGVSYSIDTIKSLKKSTNAEIFWIAGSDIVTEFDRWRNSDELLNEATFLVFPRDPYKLPESLPQGFELIKSKELLVTNISSTIIRDRVKSGKSIKYLVPEKVEKYIKGNKLYV